MRSYGRAIYSGMICFGHLLQVSIYRITSSGIISYRQLPTSYGTVSSGMTSYLLWYNLIWDTLRIISPGITFYRQLPRRPSMVIRVRKMLRE